MKLKKMFLTLVIFIVSWIVFITLDIGTIVEKADQVIQPLIFGLTLTISMLYSQYRKYLLKCAFVLLGMLVVTYLFNMLSESDWIGRLGFGMLFITIFSYLPQFIKEGYIEKF